MVVANQLWYGKMEEAAVDEHLSNFLLCQGNMYENCFSLQRQSHFENLLLVFNAKICSVRTLCNNNFVVLAKAYHYNYLYL